MIAGSLRGRRLVVPAGDDVRPTKDIVREAMFSALVSRRALANAVVLDLFAGSGALAIEALSRGARRALLIDRDQSALEAIGRNLATTGLAPVARVARGDAVTFVGGAAPAEAPFDLVFADPPYDMPADAVAAMLSALSAPGWLAAEAIIAVERPARSAILVPEGLRTGWERTFGDTLVVFVDAPDAPT